MCVKRGESRARASSQVRGRGPGSCGVREGGPRSKSPAGGDAELEATSGRVRGGGPARPRTDGAIRRLDRFSAEDSAGGKETVLRGVFSLF